MILASRAMDAEIKKYMFIVYRLTNKYSHGLSYDEMDDLKIDCMMGLYHAICDFDESKGYTLQALATKYIRGEISNYFSGRRTIIFRQNYNGLDYKQEEEIEGASEWSSDYYLTIDIMLSKGIINPDECAIIRKLASGYTYSEIGKQRGVTRQRIGTKVNRIKEKISKQTR
jgi:RNA polymerase sigma factor, sigma-70 family